MVKKTTASGPFQSREASGPFVVLVASAIFVLAISSKAQVQMNLGIPELSLDANAGAAPVTGTAFSIPTTGNTITWVTSYGTTPASITIQLQTSNDNSTWGITDTSTNTAGESRTIFTAARFVRAVESARSGGSTVTVSINAKVSPVTNTSLSTASDLSVNSITLNASAAPVVRIPNNIYIQGRNAANSAWVNMFSVGPTDTIFAGTTLEAAAITGSTISATTGITSTGNVSAGAAAFLGFATRSNTNSPADGLMNFNRNSGTVVGAQMNIGTALPTATPCTFSTGSTNTAGQMTAVGVATCTITFGAPNWSFTPFCQATEVTAARALFVSAASVSAITVSGLTAGDVFNYICLGRAF